MRFDTLPATFGTNEEVPIPELLKKVQFIETADELSVYKELSRQLSKLEKTIDYTVSKVLTIQVHVENMKIRIKEKEELRRRCEWLVIMKEIEERLNHLSTLDEVKDAYIKIGRIQTCPLKSELKQRLEKLEEKFQSSEKQFSPQEALVEAAFETGNATFINLGTAGRSKVIDEVLAGNGKVETVIAKAEELEAKVQSIKNIKSIDELRQTLLGLPLQYFSAIPSEYEEEVLQFLIENPNWNGLFQLDLQIKQFTSQLDCKYNQELEDVQEDIYQTVVLNEKLMEQLGVKQL